VLDGRFKGGYITRHYGDPARGVHAVQMEMTEAAYMDETPPYPFRADRAQAARQVLREQLGIVLEWGRQRSRAPRV
jgi:N-formylglutamate amidohydrolase